MITEETFEAARTTWHRKIEQFARREVPYMEVDDVRQEMELVLYRCLSGHDPKRSKFHTYLHAAMENRLRKLWGPFVQRGKRSRGVHPKMLVYIMGDPDSDNSGPSQVDRLMVEALTDDLDPSLGFYMDDLGFEGHEQTWLEGRTLGLSIKEIAVMQGLPEAVVREGYVSAQRKIRRMKRRGREDDDN